MSTEARVHYVEIVETDKELFGIYVDGKLSNYGCEIDPYDIARAVSGKPLTLKCGWIDAAVVAQFTGCSKRVHGFSFPENISELNGLIQWGDDAAEGLPEESGDEPEGSQTVPAELHGKADGEQPGQQDEN